ncbi:MAG: hypothetical protein KGJ07_01895 [Patescibacteria group bacterium]|nr:hypothetical protein [Patescibacteria group bacterium]
MNKIKLWYMISFASILYIILTYLTLFVTGKQGKATFVSNGIKQYACATTLIIATPNGEDSSCPTGISSSQDMFHYRSSVLITLSGAGHYQLFWATVAFWCRQPRTPSCHDLVSESIVNPIDVDLSKGS